MSLIPAHCWELGGDMAQERGSSTNQRIGGSMPSLQSASVSFVEIT